MTEPTGITVEFAEEEFKNFCKSYNLYTSTNNLNEEEEEKYISFKNQFINRVISGSLVLNDEGILEFNPKGKDEPLFLEEPEASLLSKIRGSIKKGAMSEDLAMLVHYTKKTSDYFTDMKLRDFNFLAKLVSFLANS